MLLKTLFKLQYFLYHKLDILESSTDRRSPRETLRKKNSKCTYVVHRITKSVITCYFLFFQQNYCSSSPCPSGYRCQTGFTDKRYRCTGILYIDNASCRQIKKWRFCATKVNRNLAFFSLNIP